MIRERPPRAASGWSSPAFARVAEVVHVAAGLVFPPNRQPSAESGMRRAMTALHLTDPDALGRAVQRPGEARDTVLAELTVGETYFFRDAGQLELLGSHVLPALRDRRGPDAPLRIWSAGCASGEEPYTLAIMLRELAWPHPARILGTDVARPRLDAARRGRYTRWSLRGADPARVARWFERRESQFQLAAEIRDAVQFAQLNLIADEYPSAETGTLDQDLVLCRNVLIYFDMAGVERIATRLIESLAPGGWLVLGASDPPLSGLVPCEVMMLPGGVVYRRADARGAAATTSPPAFMAAPERAPWWGSSPALVSAVHLGPALVPLPAPVPERPAAPARPSVDASRGSPGQLSDWIILVRSIANQGRLREAEAECVRALDLHRLSPELHYLHAMLLGAAGLHREAAGAARRALYLDRDFTMAHLLLGESQAQLGEVDAAVRAFGNALASLVDVPDAAAVAAADGVPASRLRQVADLRLRALRGSSRR